MWRDVLIVLLLSQVAIIWAAWRRARARRILSPRMHTIVKPPRVNVMYHNHKIEDEVEK